MSGRLAVEANWERTDAGDPEERACFAEMTISCGSRFLTEGYDWYSRRLRDGPLVSAYHAAEWLAWNWWRLRWEPRRRQESWLFAHSMATIGHGYVWPNLSFSSDGERMLMIARQSSRPDAKPFRYIADATLIVPAGMFQDAVDVFISAVLERLRQERVEETNLATLWRDVLGERSDPGLTAKRRMEALLGVDPDEADDLVASLLADASTVGQDAMMEIAAHNGEENASTLDLRGLRQAAGLGFARNGGDTVRLAGRINSSQSGVPPAWRVGAQAAADLRKAETLGSGEIGDQRLADLLGVERRCLTDESWWALSFILDDKVVLRSKWRTGRRFELARLLGDTLLTRSEALYPATSAYTYRQQMQRSFAAEFLCPVAPLLDDLRGDFSDEAIEAAAQHFSVSELTVRTLLVNHGHLAREGMSSDPEFTSASLDAA